MESLILGFKDLKSEILLMKFSNLPHQRNLRKKSNQI